MNYKYFTAFDIKYIWWAIHLARSIYVNSPSSDFTAFLILQKKEYDLAEDVINLFAIANPNCTVSLVKLDEDDFNHDELKRYCAGFRTYIFSSQNRRQSGNSTLVWIDADSIVRSPLSAIEEFCENNVFDMSARGKNTKFKFASGFVIQKDTPSAREFGKIWNRKWQKRFDSGEWTADQNAFNDTVAYTTSRLIASTIVAPREFCDVWLSDEGLIWQAKHQTKMKKRYVDEMKKYEPVIHDSPFWDDIRRNSIPVSIADISFDYRGVSFEFMGLEGEEIFEEMKRIGTFYNVNYLEAVKNLGIDDSIFIVGGGLQIDTAFLTAFTNSLMAVTFEPNTKMIDLGLRNAQNNPGSSRCCFSDKKSIPQALKELGIKKNALTLYTNWEVSDGGKQYSAICPSLGKYRFYNGKYRYGATPSDMDYSNDNHLKNGKYKKIRKLCYESDDESTVEKFNKKLIEDPNSLSAFSATFDTVASSVFNQFYESHVMIERQGRKSPFSAGEPRENYDFSKFIGLIMINVYGYSLEIFETCQETLQYFHPHVGIVVYDMKDQADRIQKIERLLGTNYKKVYDEPEPLEPGARCLIYQSSRRAN